MNKYLVIATVWSEEKKAQIKVVKGEFAEWFMASLFAQAYNEHFSANATIVTQGI